MVLDHHLYNISSCEGWAEGVNASEVVQWQAGPNGSRGCNASENPVGGAQLPRAYTTNWK